MPVVHDVFREMRMWRDKDGDHCLRVFLVVDIDVEPRYARMFEAVNHPEVPKQGAELKIGRFSSKKLICHSVNASPEADPTKFRIECEYGPPRPDENAPTRLPAQIEIGSTTSSVQTNRDISGKQIVLQRVVPHVGPVDPVPIEEQVGELDVEMPMPFVRFTRKEEGDPLVKSVEYTGAQGRMNLPIVDPEDVDVGPPEPGKVLIGGSVGNGWLCLSIVGTTTDGGDLYDVKYEFQFNQAGWNPVAGFQDKEKKQLVALADIHNPSVNSRLAYKYVQVYPKKDFKELELLPADIIPSEPS